MERGSDQVRVKGQGQGWPLALQVRHGEKAGRLDRGGGGQRGGGGGAAWRAGAGVVEDARGA